MFTRTESEYAPADQEEKEPLEPTYNPPKRNSVLRQYFPALVAVILTCFMLLGTFYTLYSHSKCENSTCYAAPKSFVPIFPPTQTRFTEDERYLRLDQEGDRHWDEMIPNGAGYVRVPYPRQYGLESSVPFGVGDDPEEAEVYQVSLIHQIHCLGTLRFVLQAYKRGEVLNNQWDSEEHMNHCLNNLRQALLCAADHSLIYLTNKGRLPNGEYEGKVNGNGTVHVCRNWEATMDFMVEKRVKDRTGGIAHT